MKPFEVSEDASRIVKFLKRLVSFLSSYVKIDFFRTKKNNMKISPFSAVSCFSAGRSIAAGNTAGSERPFELNA